MYRPSAFDLESPSEILDALRRISFGHLVTSHPAGGGLESTPLPFVVDDEITHARAHVARANRHWTRADGRPGLLIIAGPDAYVSPRWYPSKAEHGRVVPTWNYEVIHVHGVVEVHDDPAWTLDVVEALTAHHESRVVDPERTEAWAVSDAPDAFVAAQLRGIVGVELRITSIEAKRKLSQNRSSVDRAGVIDGLERTARVDQPRTAEQMRSEHRRLDDDSA